MYIWEAKTQNMKKQLLFVFFIFFSFLSIVRATERDSIFPKKVVTPPVNDECSGAISVAINLQAGCSVVTPGSTVGSTASSNPTQNCPTGASYDVWFTFTATSTYHQITFSDFSNLNSNFIHSVYSGTCDDLDFFYCPSTSFRTSRNTNFIIGQTYYVRASSNSAQLTFNVCVLTMPVCEDAVALCSFADENNYIFQNTTDIPSTGGVACLVTTFNPSYFSLNVSQSGPLNFEISQNTSFNDLGNPVGSNLDVDFIAWGPFATLESCDQIAFSNCSSCPNNTDNPNFYPFGNVVDCSFDASYIETFSIENAVAGEYYIILVTNYDGYPGSIKFSQTNLNDPNAGSISCGSSNLQLVAFVDQNQNGVKDTNETNFTYGTFTSQKNEELPVSVSSPLGIFSVFDSNASNLYDFGFVIDAEYSAYYAATLTNYNDISVALENGTQHLYFPITITQDYTDVNVSLVPLTDPRPGFLYTNKIIYKNTGTTAASGTLYFTKDDNVTIDSVDQLGIINTPSGFSYEYTNLLPSETRSFNVNMSVPSIPTVNINDVLTNTITSTIPEADINVLNNTTVISQVVIGAYDPNDKIEAHGESIDFNSFTQDDFLVYTIRFQNTGTANAINVRIEDELDAQLDETSVRMISSSHNYIMERTNNKLIWSFNNIQLPPQITNEEASNGYVTFKIKPNAGFALGDIIPNFAEIYFDTNPPIITNTFNSTFEEQLATPEFSSGNLLIYPNPSNGLVYINTQNTTENLKEINLYDVLGKTILSSKNLSSRQSTIDVSSLAKGIYMIEITTENNYKQTKKLVVK